MLLAHEPMIRLGAFAGILAVMALWEWLSPRRHQEIGRLRRWPSNLGIIALNSVVVRLVFPAAAVGTALLAEARAGDFCKHLMRRPGLRSRRR